MPAVQVPINILVGPSPAHDNLGPVAQAPVFIADLATVVTHARRIVNELTAENPREQPFIIGGSYAAAVISKRLGHPVHRYNDIDIYYETTRPDILMKFARDPTRRHITLANGEQLEFNLVELGHGWYNLSNLADDFDINNITVGMEISAESQSITPYITNDFIDFCNTQTLRLINIGKERNPAGSLVRLLYKSHQLGLQYEVPADYKDLVHGRLVNEDKIGKMAGFGPQQKRTIYNAFDIHGPYNVRFDDGARGRLWMFLRLDATEEDRKRHTRKMLNWQGESSEFY